MDGTERLEKIAGVIENVVYRNENNDYTVLEIVTDKNELVTAVGIIPMAFEGERVELCGKWSFHKEFGRQFSFESFEKMLPKEADGIIQYLSSSTVKGIGPVTALKIVNRFGVESFDVIENHPEWLADIPGITLKKAAQISESFRQQTGIRGVMMLCGEYIASAEITRVYKKLGAGAEGLIRDNPYILCEEDYGISFDKVDRFAKTLDIPSDSELRVISGIKYILSYNAQANGHTCLPKEKLALSACRLLEISEERAEYVISQYLEHGVLGRVITDGAEYVMMRAVYDAEKYIANKLSRLDSQAVRFSVSDVSSLIERLEVSFGIEYARLQKDAIYEALSGGVMILTGGPGTGKTTVVKALISIFSSLGMKYVLAAPTGRAAKRMSEATGEEAKTIHRMLEMERHGGTEIRFGRDERNPLEENAIIIDEASMMDLALTEALMHAVRVGARLILIGDKDQLPSVGAGNIFSDLIDSNTIRSVRLTEIFRQSKESLIVTNAHRINSGEAPIMTVTDNDFFFVRREYERDIAKTVSSLVLERLPKTYGAEIREQIQVITPSKKGFGGVEVLNAELQSKINPPRQFKRELTRHGVVFREGDRVMQTANNYDLEWEKDGVTGSGIFNGDIGIIEAINSSKEQMLIRFDDRLVTYDFDLLDDLDLAYAITVHKSQGSEYPVVIIPMYLCAPMLMTRNLLYTAVTRAKRMVILVGRSDVAGKMAENNKEILRYTTLKKRMLDAYC